MRLNYVGCGRVRKGAEVSVLANNEILVNSVNFKSCLAYLINRNLWITLKSKLPYLDFKDACFARWHFEMNGDLSVTTYIQVLHLHQK